MTGVIVEVALAAAGLFALGVVVGLGVGALVLSRRQRRLLTGDDKVARLARRLTGAAS
jgi:hypothetical protein